MIEKIIDTVSKLINPPQKQSYFTLNPDSLADLLPWGYFAEGTEFPVMINKDGRFQTTFSFRGHDLDSSTVHELTRAADILNNALKRLGSDWSFHVDAIRKKSRDYSTKEGIKNIPVYLLEVEREEFFKSGFHYESEYYITFSWLTPTDQLKKAGNLFFERTNEIEIINTTEENLKYYRNEMINIDGLLSSIFKEFRVLTEEETLTYYHSLVSDTDFIVKVPEANAQAIEMKAEAEKNATFKEAEGNERLAKSLDSKIIEYNKINKWNGTLPQVSGNGTPIIDFRER